MGRPEKTVTELIAELQKLPPDMIVGTRLTWDDDSEELVRADLFEVRIEGRYTIPGIFGNDHTAADGVFNVWSEAVLVFGD